jgi:Insect cuticle protein
VEDSKTGNKQAHTESRDGDVVRGEYSLLEADGTMRIVQYTADPRNGFQAVVKRAGHAPEVFGAPAAPKQPKQPQQQSSTYNNDDDDDDDEDY